MTIDENFRWLMNESAEHVHADPVLRSVFKKFGADAFRRSSGVELFDPFLRDIGFSGRRCVEIGTYNGITAIILSRYFEEVVSFDIFPHTMKHTIVEYLGIRNIKFVDIKDNEEKAEIISGLDFDAAYSDGDHINDAAFDFNLVRKCKRVLFHEYWDMQKPVYDLVNGLRASDEKVLVQGKFAYWDGRARG